MKKNNKKAFSLILSIFMVFICTLLALYLLEYIIPFLKNTKWMENWVKAYYQAYNWIENALLEKKWNNVYYENSRNFWQWPSDYSFEILSTWSSIPSAWEWNSDFDKDYNTISLTDPVQLLLTNGINWNDVKFYFKVPKFNDNNENDIVFFNSWTYNVVNWQLSSPDDTLYASWAQIVKWNQISSSLNSNPNGLRLSLNEWYIYKETWEKDNKNFDDFYVNNCSGPNSGCTLKLSIINELKTDSWGKIPFLEYKATWFNPKKIANYFTIIKSSWKSFWYKRSLKIYIPQQTTSSAFDFTIFQ